MPRAFSVYTSLSGGGFDDRQRSVIAGLIQKARTPNSIYDFGGAVDDLFNSGFSEELSEEIARLLRCCFPCEKFRTTYNRTRIKTDLVRSGLRAAFSVRLLVTIDPCLATPPVGSRLVAVQYPPGTGKVVMCDFRHWIRPAERASSNSG